MGTPSDQFIRSLTSEHRVVALGGLAVIAHGNPRKTEDGDIWLDPLTNAGEWSTVLMTHLQRYPDLSLHRLPGWRKVEHHEELVDAVEETRMIRILGLDHPLDVFRHPNEVLLEHFDLFFQRGRRRSDGTVLPHPLDLIETKLNTGRDKDLRDIAFLEDLVRQEYREKLPTATPAEATELLERFSDWQVLRAAGENPHAEVRALARRHLEEFAAAGDPFSQAILAGREIP